MKTSPKWNFRSLAGKVVLGLALITMVGSIDVAQAVAKDDHKRAGKHDNGRYEQRGHGHDRYRHVQNRRVYGHYGYNRDRHYGPRERAYYPPPPVVYAPPPPPGIGIFFPPVFIHR